MIREDFAANLVSLRSYSYDHKLPFFAAILVSKPTDSFLYALTPKVMKWSDNLWLFDLRPCEHFWLCQAKRQFKTPISLIEEVLKKHQEEWIAVFASHPWQAIFVIHYLQEIGQSYGQANDSKVINLLGPFGKSLYQKASWSAWFFAFPQVAEHWAMSHKKGFQKSRFFSQIAQMKRSLAKLNSQGPHFLQNVSKEAIRRRFGSLLSEVWEWTYFSKKEDKENQKACNRLFYEEREFSFAGSFPWHNFEFVEKPQVERFFEESLNTWETIEPFLRIDLDSFCTPKMLGHDECVVLIRWDITFFHMKEFTLFIRFRNPHFIHKEKGSHETTLAQARFAFGKLREELQNRDDDLDFPKDIPLVSWKVTIDEKIIVSSFFYSLFSDRGKKEQAALKILELENKLPVPLEKYSLSADFYPLEAYCVSEERALTSEELKLWSLAAIKRPLFIYEKPKLIDSESFKSNKIAFLERTSLQWWKEGLSSSAANCDYYSYIDFQSKRAYWVARNKENHWYAYGIYS